MGINELIDELAAAERDFAGSRFLAPVVPGAKVRVRIAGLVAELVVEGDAEAGFAVLEATGGERARVVRRASKREIADYLRILAQVRLVLAEPLERCWLALPAYGGTQRIEIEGIVPVQLVQGSGRFDTVLARFDGCHFWFEGRDRRRERAIADYLRAAYAERRAPSALERARLSPQERAAYALAVAREAERAKQTDEGRLREALAHAGGRLETFVEHGDRYQVSWAVDGRRVASAVGKDDLTVLVAGVCLAGQDRRFDLASLVGVLRERGARGIPVIGDGGMDVDEYFRIHPEQDE